jgi:hypothetical protein
MDMSVKLPSAGNFIFIIILLGIGAFAGNWLLGNYAPQYQTGWIGGILLGLIQMLILTLLGMATGKLSITLLLFGALVIFAGAMIGGWLTGYLNLTGIFATIIVFAIQAVLLSVTGIAKGSGSGMTKLPKVK